MRKFIFSAAVIGCFVLAANKGSAAIIYQNDFEDSNVQSSFSSAGVTGGITLAYTSYSATGGNPDGRLLVSGTGGSGAGSAILNWDLGQSYDFYANGQGAVSIDVNKFSTTPDLVIKLMSGGSVQSSLTYTPVYSWETVSIPVDSNDTAIDAIQFTVRRTSGSSGPGVYLDNFVAQTVPEPMSLGSLGLSLMGLAMLRRRRSVA